MAVVQGIREKVHLPIYDSVHVKPKEQLRDVENVSSSILRFFVDVQRKTKLETNLQSASLLPHYNTFEARAMRVVISDLPPDFSEKVNAEVQTGNTTEPTLNTNLKRLLELLDEAKEDDDGKLKVRVEDGEEVDTGGTQVTLDIGELQNAIDVLDDKGEAPPKEQLEPNNGAGTLIGKFIYNTVTTLYVGEKIMIQMPTWFFPAGAGPYSEAGHFTTHGEPSPTATFRFAEPIFIDKQQNFRVEIEVPDTDVLREIQKIYGPLFIWVVLDGYTVRDVQ